MLDHEGFSAQRAAVLHVLGLLLGDRERAVFRHPHAAGVRATAIHQHIAELLDAADLAASYAYGIARNHPFVDGNKRTAAVISETFLVLNGYSLNATDAELVVATLTLAAGELSEVELADWFRMHLGQS